MRALYAENDKFQHRSRARTPSGRLPPAMFGYPIIDNDVWSVIARAIGFKIPAIQA